MTAFSNFLETELLDHIMNGAAYPSPPSVFIALFTAPPSDAGGGTEVTTVGTGYARQQVTGGFTLSAGRAGNTAAITFPTALLGWGTIVSVGIFDAVTAGNLLFHGALVTGRLVEADDIFSFPADELGITLD